MEAINTVLVFLVALGGYLLGVGLSYIAPEELKPGERYFLILEKGLFALTTLPIIYFLWPEPWTIFPAAVSLIFLFFKFQYRLYGSFGLFLVWFFLVRDYTTVVLLLASAIFIYGLVAGTMALDDLAPTRVSKLEK